MKKLSSKYLYNFNKILERLLNKQVLFTTFTLPLRPLTLLLFITLLLPQPAIHFLLNHVDLVLFKQYEEFH